MIEFENLTNSNSSFRAEIKSRINSTIDSGWYILGNEVLEFESEFAKYCQTNHCIGVGSGLDAIFLAIKSLNLPPKSEILVPSNTFIATILAIIQSGHIPVPVEPRIETYNINPDLIEEKISSNTKAIIVVHLYGKACEMAQISTICEKYELKLIEDCAQSHGASLNGKKTGSFGIGTFSFYPTKNLGSFGDAGCITTNEQTIDDQIRMLRNYGSSVKYSNEILGFNSRLDEIQASVLNVKLKYLDSINDHKKKLAALYNQNLKNDFTKPAIKNGYYDVFHIYTIRHERRDELKEYLLNEGIKTEIHYPIPPHKQKALADIWGNLELPITEEIHRTTLSLPISYGTTSDEVEKVIEVLNKF